MNLPFPLQVDDELELHLLQPQHTEAFFEAIMANHAHLDPWLRWSGRIQTLDDAAAYIQRCEARWAADDGFHAGLWQQGRLIGGIASPFINRDSRKGEIGYWLIAGVTGQGIVTRATSRVLTLMFNEENLHRIELQAAADNVRSRAVAERLGFTLEGIKRESEWIGEGFRDHALYSLLAREWRLREPQAKN
jgi:ribosomal-protein-serine acetyltransferase